MVPEVKLPVADAEKQKTTFAGVKKLAAALRETNNPFLLKDSGGAPLRCTSWTSRKMWKVENKNRKFKLGHCSLATGKRYS